MPDTLHDRSVIVDLKRRLPSETIEPFRPDRARHLDVLARKAARWAKDHAVAIAETDPQMPPEIFNRDADNWRPLLAIAEVAGDKWPKLAQQVAKLCCAVSGVDDASRLELLLGDIRDTFAQLGAAPVAELFATSADLEIPSKPLVEALAKIEGRPWAEMGKNGKPITQNRLARMLKPLGIRPGKVGPEEARLNGYKLSQFKDAFDRYLGPEGASQPDNRTEGNEKGLLTFPKWTPKITGVRLRNAKNPITMGLCPDVQLQRGTTSSTFPGSLTGAPAQCRTTADPRSALPARTLQRCPMASASSMIVRALAT